MWIFKTAGLLLLFLCCSAFGFIKAATLKKRSDKLSGFIKGLCELSERIRTGGGEIERLLKLCFERKLGVYQNGSFGLSTEYLLKEDISLLNEFFGDLGMRDTRSEYERCCLYKTLVENRQKEAEQNFRELSKLYNTLGVLSGIFIILFFL